MCVYLCVCVYVCVVCVYVCSVCVCVHVRVCCECVVCECGVWHSRESAPSSCSIKLVHICVGGCYSLSNQTERKYI